MSNGFYYEHELHESNEWLFVSFVLFVFEKKRIFSGYLMIFVFGTSDKAQFRRVESIFQMSDVVV